MPEAGSRMLEVRVPETEAALKIRINEAVSLLDSVAGDILKTANLCI
jgi:hypothetical protein